MGGIIIKPRIIILTKRNLMIYTALLLILVIGIILFMTFRGNAAGVTSSGYTYLKYKDGTYVGSEKTDEGNMKVEVTIKSEKIKDVKILELPAKYLKENPSLKEELPRLVIRIIDTQEIVSVDSPASTAYVLNKISKCVRNALDKSLIAE